MGPPHPIPIGHPEVLQPGHQAERLGRLSILTENSVLLLIDGGEHTDSDIEQLYDAVKSQQTPVVMLRVLRRFAGAQPARHEFWLKADLTRPEADRFRNSYGQLVPKRAPQLAALASSTNDRERTAFYFGLTAYERDFAGLPKFVEARLCEPDTSARRKLLCYLAIAHQYAQQPLPAAACRQLLQLPRDRKVQLRKAFPAETLDLLTEAEAGLWRTSHALVAEEILAQCLGPDSPDPYRLWMQSLSSSAIEFAEFTRGESPVPSEPMLKIARRAFVLRDNDELLGTERSAYGQFSQLLEEIPSREGRLEVLRKLSEIFPEEAHFHAHLGRYCGLNGSYEEAASGRWIAQRQNQQRGPRPPPHGAGMISRYRVNDMIGKSGATLRDPGEHAQPRAQPSRRHAVSTLDEHGYVSELQFLIKVLDHIGRDAKRPVPELLADSKTDPFLREAIDRAEGFLDQVRIEREGERPSRYIEECRGSLDRLYGRYSEAIQTWNNLLARRDVYQPPIRRQVVSISILRRHNGEWGDLKQKELARSAWISSIENYVERPDDHKSLQLWLRAIRHARVPRH